jgi:hypothetical protein
MTVVLLWMMRWPKHRGEFGVSPDAGKSAVPYNAAFDRNRLK